MFKNSQHLHHASENPETDELEDTHGAQFRLVSACVFLSTVSFSLLQSEASAVHHNSYVVCVVAKHFAPEKVGGVLKDGAAWTEEHGVLRVKQAGDEVSAG
jgi:hypothetical protein